MLEYLAEYHNGVNEECKHWFWSFYPSNGGFRTSTGGRFIMIENFTSLLEERFAVTSDGVTWLCPIYEPDNGCLSYFQDVRMYPSIFVLNYPANLYVYRSYEEEREEELEEHFYDGIEVLFLI